jgi:magnesium transporter
VDLPGLSRLGLQGSLEAIRPGSLLARKAASGMDVCLISDEGVEQHQVEELQGLLEREAGLVWVDIPQCDEQASRVLSEVFRFHPLAIRDCVERNQVPKVHPYADHLFVVLHAAERGEGGHVHLLELDQFIGANYLVTVHGPINPAVDPELALRETSSVRHRIEAGRLRPRSPLELSYALVSALTRHQEAVVATLAREAGRLEQRVMGGDIGDPEPFLEELFRARHELLVVRTMSAQSREVCGRIGTLDHLVSLEARPRIEDLVDQFGRVRSMADGEKEFLQGVIEFYQTRTETKMTIAAERLAVIAAVTLPITALSSIYGMNVIVNQRTHVVHLIVVLVIMVAMSAALLRWARQQGWW